MRVNQLFRFATGLATTLSLVAACSTAPTTTPEPQVQPAVPQVQPITKAGGTPDQCPQPVAQPPCPTPDVAPPLSPVPAAPVPAVCPRFVAFTSQAFCQGSLFVYDDAIKDVYILNGALAGLPFLHVPFVQLQAIEPTFYGASRVLFDFAGCVYYYDMNTEERVTLAIDAFPCGAHPRISETGILVYINVFGDVVMLPEDGGPYLAKPRVITKIAAERAVQLGFPGFYYPAFPFYYPVCDVDISADGRWIVVSLNGKLFLYDVVNPHLFQVLPLGGIDLTTFPSNIGHVAISPDGRFIAFTVCDGFASRLLLLDRVTGLIDPVPYPNLGYGGYASIHNPRFLGDCLFFEICTGLGFKVWRYDIHTELLSALVILNNTLGELGTDTLISSPVL
ncbi:MAG TPA: hypothetical protein V6D05_11315 [Stenomitos sp.]